MTGAPGCVQETGSVFSLVPTAHIQGDENTHIGGECPDLRQTSINHSTKCGCLLTLALNIAEDVVKGKIGTDSIADFEVLDRRRDADDFAGAV